MDHQSRVYICRLRFSFALLLTVLFGMARPCDAQDSPGDGPDDGTAVAQSNLSPSTSGGMAPEPGVLSRAIQFAIDKFDSGGQTKKDGWYLELSNMITGAGWVSVGPGYRHYMFKRQAFADVSAATSWHLYKMVQGRFEIPETTTRRVTAGVQTMWQDQTQMHYFGIGPDSPPEDESLYRLRSTDFVGYGSFRPSDSFTITGELGWLHAPKVSIPAGTFKPNLPDTVDEFALDPGVNPFDQPDYIHSELAATIDTRDYEGHPTRGGMYRAAMTTYRDQRDGIFSFQQYEAEAAHFARLAGPSWILVLHGWIVASDVGSGHDEPFYLLPTLGGANTLRSYSNYRFHDRNLALFNVESRWAIFEHVDAAAFFDAGNVAPDVSGLNFGKRSVGGGVRLHTERTTFARFDAGYGSEGWHFALRTSDPFRFARLKRHVASLPFVP